MSRSEKKGSPTSKLDYTTSGAEDIPKLGLPSQERPPLDLTRLKGCLGDSSGGLAGSSLRLARTTGNLPARVTARYLSSVTGPSASERQDISPLFCGGDGGFRRPQIQDWSAARDPRARAPHTHITSR